jgi:hypothetical protein
MKKLIIVLAVIWAAPALAQAPRATPGTARDLGNAIRNTTVAPEEPTIGGIRLTGNIKKDAQAVWQQIQTAALVDLQYASAMAGAANTSASAIRKQCWDAIIVVNQQSNGVGLKGPDGNPMQRPDPHLFTDVETAAEIIDNLSPQGKLYTSCAGAAQLFQANVIQFISAAVAGAAGIAKLSPIPGL